MSRLVAIVHSALLAARSPPRLRRWRWVLPLECSATFRTEAASLGCDTLEVDKMWSKLSQISVIAGRQPDLLTAEEYLTARDAFAAAVIAMRGPAEDPRHTVVRPRRGDVPTWTNTRPALRKP
jgi:hypothetical protein